MSLSHKQTSLQIRFKHKPKPMISSYVLPNDECTYHIILQISLGSRTSGHFAVHHIWTIISSLTYILFMNQWSSLARGSWLLMTWSTPDIHSISSLPNILLQMLQYCSSNHDIILSHKKTQYYTVLRIIFQMISGLIFIMRVILTK